jgi:hypothetical protein
MNQPIIFVSGSKGGVGKSLTTMAVLDYLTTEHRYVRLLEADTTNPDVWKAYRRNVEGEVSSLDEIDGWINLINICDANPFKAIVINTPARNNDAVRLHGGVLLDALKELARPLITLWVINRQRDSLELLRNYLDVMTAGVVHVVRNGYFGDQSKFELFQSSAMPETISQMGGKSLFLPDLADRVTDELYSRRITLQEAAQQLKLGDRVELQRWRGAVRDMMTQAGV